MTFRYILHTQFPACLITLATTCVPCISCVYLGPPEITYISPDITYLEGTKATLVCNGTNDADAVNKVQIAWFYKNSTSLYQIVSNNNNHIVHNVVTSNSSSGNFYSILLFDPVHRTDEGVYICKANNHPQSSTESSTEIKIKSK